MDVIAQCSHCGLTGDHDDGHLSNLVDPDSIPDDQRRIQELTREVRLLQKTVAQLRAIRH